MDRDELEMAAAAGRVLDDCKRFIARVLDESSGRSTTEYTEPVEEWARRLGVLMLGIGWQALRWAEARGHVVVDGPVDTREEEDG
ncbi:hypothetical protein [Saccharothrix obliqua]|uniref:hypothetical protein n=1 Tax=Saccharothrix obliqua TaxID=2861747 RepID=UPI001C5F2DC1|nr:hypothetical protein [Saccharothrix obliqua]MBW4719755.1 hypothetical protein [Saccharothrix obliqua]